MIKRVGEAVQPGQHYRLRPGAYAILRRADSILLTQQSEPRPELQLPGGGFEPTEHTLPALHREVLEETGWTMRVHRRIGAFRRFTYMPEYDLWAEKLCTIYLGRPVQRKCAPTDAGHIPVWLPLVEAAHMIENSGDRAFVASLLR